MRRPLSSCLLVLTVAATCLGCAPPALQLPPGAVCAKMVTAAAGPSALSEALGRAVAGTCVVAAPGHYTAALSVPEGVTLAAEVGATVEVAGDAASVAAVTLAAGATLSGVHIVSAPGIGVSLAANSTLVGVVVQSAGSAGVVDWCEEDCRVDDVSELRDVELRGNAVGLLVHGAHLKTVGGRVADSQSASLASGYGVVASHGAVLEMVDTVVENNEELGLLVDGAGGTEAALQGVAVRDNQGRGIWAQGLTGTAAAPKLRLSSCIVEGNRLVGVGARASAGLQIHGGRVTATAVGPAASETPGVLVNVGDGIGLFEQTGEVQVDGVTLYDNQRTQVLIDHGAAGLSIQGSTVTPGAGQLGLVVQRTQEPVAASDITTPAAGQELGISAPTLSVPTR